MGVKERTLTGISGLDDALNGGIPRGNVVLVSGGPGTGKSILLNQFLVNGIRMYDEPGVLVSLEEARSSTIRNMAAFGWDLEEFENENKLSIIDASPMLRDDRLEMRPDHPIHGRQEFSINALVDLIFKAVKSVNAKRIVVDSITTLTLFKENIFAIRQDLLNLVRALKAHNITTLISCESPKEDEIGRFGVEGFMSDGVLEMKILSRGTTRTRTIEISKMRGIQHVMNPLLLVIGSEGIQVSDMPPID